MCRPVVRFWCEASLVRGTMCGWRVGVVEFGETSAPSVRIAVCGVVCLSSGVRVRKCVWHARMGGVEQCGL